VEVVRRDFRSWNMPQIHARTRLRVSCTMRYTLGHLTSRLVQEGAVGHRGREVGVGEEGRGVEADGRMWGEGKTRG